MSRTKMIEIRGKRSQKEIADLLGISQQQYSNIENGKRGIKPKYFKKFEIVFNEKIENLAPYIFCLMIRQNDVRGGTQRKG